MTQMKKTPKRGESRDWPHARIPPDIHRRLKIEAAKQGCSVQELVERYLVDGLRGPRKDVAA